MSSFTRSSFWQQPQRLLLFLVGSLCLGLLLTGLGAVSLQAQTEPTADQQPLTAPAVESNGETAAPLAPSLTVTKTDTLVGDADTDSLTDPGDVLSYTVTIHNSGDMDATGVVFSDTIDANTTLSGTVHVSPIAFADSYTSTGNVGITVPVGSGVLANDVDPDNNSGSLTVVGFDVASANGGTVAAAADGSFTYDPAPGFSGVDSFTYTLSDGDPVTPDDVETVTITVSEMVWFIDNSQAAGDGRLGSPFNTLAAFTAVNGSGGNNPGASDCIFIYETGSGVYTGGVTLENNQVLIGQGATDNLANLCGLTLPPFSNVLPATSGSRPQISNTPGTGHGVTLAAGNLLRGFNIGDTDTGFGLSGTNVGTAVGSEMGISGNGGLVDINTGTLNMTFDSLATTGSSAEGIDLDSVGGTFVVSAPLSIANTGAAGIDINNSTAAFTFSGATKTINTGTQPGVNLTNNSGATFDFINGGLDIDTTSGTGFNTSGGGTVNVTGNNNFVTTVSSSGVNIVDTTIGASGITWHNLTINGGINAAINLNNTGSGVFMVTGDGNTGIQGGNGSGGVIQNVTEDAIRLFNTNGLVTLQNMTIRDIGDMSIANPGHHGIDGQQVEGGIALRNVTLARISDSAIHGEAPGGGSTTWNGLTISDSILRDSNRFHIAGEADGNSSSDEAMVTIEGLRGIVIVTDNDFDDGPGFLNLHSATSGVLDVTIQSNTFDEGRKDLVNQQSVGSFGIAIWNTGSINSTIRIGDPGEANPALGNSFTNGGSKGAISVTGFTASDSSNVDVVISRNTTTVTDHTSPSGLGPIFDFPNGGIALESRGSGSFEGIVSYNTFVQTQNSGGISTGSLRLDFSGSNTEMIARNNTFDRVWDGPIFVRADNLDGNGVSGQLLLEGNSYIEGLIGVPGSGDDLDVLGFANSPSPYLPNRITVRNGATLDLTHRNETLPEHDTVSNPGYPASFDVRVAGTGGTLNVHTSGLASPDGYLFRNDAGGSGDINLSTGASGVGVQNNASLATIANTLSGNGSTGGSNSNTTDPPVVSVPFGDVDIVASLPTVPSITTPFRIISNNDSPYVIESNKDKVVNVSFPPDTDIAQSSLQLPFMVPLVNEVAFTADTTADMISLVRDTPHRAPVSGETANINLGVLEPAQTVTIIFQVAVDDPLNSAATQVCNQAVVSSNELSVALSDDPDVGGSADATCTPLDLEADLTLTKTESIDPVIPGSGAGNLTYAITVTNQGPDPVTGVTVNEALTLPTGVTLNGVAVSAGSFSNPTWSIPSLAVGTSARMTVTLTAATGAPAGSDIISNTASVTGASATLLNTGDDSATLATSIDDETRCGLGVGTHTFNQTTRPVTITVNTAGTLDCITIIPTDGDHPNATTGIASTSDLHWSISATGSGFAVDVTFPADTVTGDASLFKTCRTDDNGANWECLSDADGNPGTVSRINVTAFSNWQNCGGCGPTAVTLQSRGAHSPLLATVWLLLMGLLLSLVITVTWRWRSS